MIIIKLVHTIVIVEDIWYVYFINITGKCFEKVIRLFKILWYNSRWQENDKVRIAAWKSVGLNQELN